MTISVYTIIYAGHKEHCIISDNFTGTGGFDFHLVSLGGNNEVLYNCNSIDGMKKFIFDNQGIKGEVKLNLVN